MQRRLKSEFEKGENMKFITAEQFKAADQKVQDAIMEWWKPSIGDLTNGRENPVVCIKMPRDIRAIADYNNSSITYFPLLTIGQLIEFIEWHSKGSLDIRNRFNEDYSVIVWGETEFKAPYIRFKIVGTGPLINRLFEMASIVVCQS